MGEEIQYTRRFVQDNELQAVLEVPHPGQYLVTLTIAPEQELRNVRIFARGRRLYEAAPSMAAGGTYSFPLYVQVCDVIPHGEAEIKADRTIDISVVADGLCAGGSGTEQFCVGGSGGEQFCVVESSGEQFSAGKSGREHSCISGIQLQETVCPVIHLAGDSTVTDQVVGHPCVPETSYAGWGQMFPYYLGGGIAVANHAYSGLTTETFRQKGYYSIVEGCRKAGDYLFLQFGHNDQKQRHLRAWEGYRDNLLRYIEESRTAGLYPVLVTPLARNTWRSDGSYNDLLEENAAACIELGREQQVPVLDLHARSMEYIIGKGCDGAKPLFVPGDYTHTNICGAQIAAGMVAAEMKRVLGTDTREAYRRLAELVLEKKPCDEPRQEILAASKQFAVGLSVEMLEEVIWTSQKT